jgi:hypothetical protein
MKITVIPSDKLIIVNGEPRECDFVADENIHAIQFSGDEGVVEVRLGDGYGIDAAGIQPYIDAWVAAAPVPPVPVDPTSIVPYSCTRRQGRLALLAEGYLDTVEAAIAAIEDPVQRKAAQIEYEADTWERNNAFLQSMWAQLGGTPEGLDDLFRYAVTQ